jgi:hypothetical protein
MKISKIAKLVTYSETVSSTEPAKKLFDAAKR